MEIDDTKSFIFATNSGWTKCNIWSSVGLLCASLVGSDTKYIDFVLGVPCSNSFWRFTNFGSHNCLKFRKRLTHFFCRCNLVINNENKLYYSYMSTTTLLPISL